MDSPTEQKIDETFPVYPLIDVTDKQLVQELCRRLGYSEVKDSYSVQMNLNSYCISDDMLFVSSGRGYKGFGMVCLFDSLGELLNCDMPSQC